VLSDWYQISPDERLNIERTLLIFPKGSTGYIIAFNNEVFHYKRDITASYPILITASNRFLGVSHSITGIHDFQFWDHLPERIG
ncbi:hypothetical protein R0J89_20010, partial [Psychrobacter sp. SIMBA_152]